MTGNQEFIQISRKTMVQNQRMQLEKQQMEIKKAMKNKLI
jgi:hypothetical protein